MLIVYINNGPGWQPITYMANLAAELFEAELVVLDSKLPKAMMAKLEMLLLKRNKSTGNETCLMICPDATSALNITQIKGWRKRFRCLAVLVIESYWVNRIPKVVKLSHPFDHIFVTSEEDLQAWTEAMQTPTTYLARATDVLRLGGANMNADLDRSWDLTRIGRQPPEWDDDNNTNKQCADLNLRFHGRMKNHDTAEGNQIALMQLYQQSKFMLAFSNTAHRDHYTHPVRQYITERWTDALACGAVVAGIVPNEPSIKRLLWDGATLELGTIKIKDGLQIIAEAAKLWKPEQALKNYQYALQRLDWRWRFADIAAVLGESPKRLIEEIKWLEQKIAAGQITTAVSNR